MTPWDEVHVGQVVELGTYRFTAERIAAFSASFDSVDTTSLSPGPTASPWMVAAVFMRLNVLQQQQEAAERLRSGLGVPEFGPSPGVSGLRWMRPVRPGETLRYRQTVTEKRASRSRAGWGMLATLVEAVEQASGDLAFTMKGAVFMRTAPSTL